MPPHEDHHTDLDAFGYLLSYSHVHIADWSQVQKKLQHLADGGKDKLLVISDFDFTLTRSETDNGEYCWSTHGVFTNCAHEVHPDIGENLKALKEKYHPYEISPKLTVEEKIPYMEQWWGKAHEGIIEVGFEKWKIEEFVKNAMIHLRAGTEDVILELEMANVPFVVFSAGIGNIIEIFFDIIFKRPIANMHIISNMIHFNDQDRAASFSEPMIHTFCKNSSVIRKDEQFYKEMSQRDNVILMGDSLGDIHMDVGVPKDGPTLRIGFLNNNVDMLLEKFMELYDIVIVKDQTMAIPGQIIRDILQPK